jgi:peptidylprolyl isomerase
MRQAKQGDTVRVHYTGTLTNGMPFDSSVGREPLEFTLGEGGVIAGFDDAVTGMTVGQTKTVTIPAAEAYGGRREEMLLNVPRAQVPPSVTPEVGQQLRLGRGAEAVDVTVREVTDEHVVLDANHPLAGEDLTFELELVEIV